MSFVSFVFKAAPFITQNSASTAENVYFTE
jgi:hypothetical protein